MVEIPGGYDAFEMAKKMRIENDAGLSEFDRDMIGRAAAQIRIPFADLDQVAMRHVGGVLHGLATTMEAWSQRHDIPQRDVLAFLRLATKEANARIQEIKDGKKRRADKPQDDVALVAELAAGDTGVDSAKKRQIASLRGGNLRFIRGRQ